MTVLTDLDPVDLRRLRQITRRIHHKDFPHLPVLSDHQCDVVIERIGGPIQMEQVVREAVDQGDFPRHEVSKKPVYTGPVDAFSEMHRHYEDLDTGDGE